MVKLDKFEIQFTLGNSIYYPGEEITGNLVFRLRKRQKINAIYLKFKGKADIYW